MDRDDPREEIDALLQRLSTYDVSVERAERIKTACLAKLRSKTTRPSRGRTSTAARSSFATWLEPVAALAASAVYLAAALQAATLLLSLQ